MIVVYRVPHVMDPAIKDALAERGIVPGDEVVIENDKAPAQVRELGPWIKPYLRRLTVAYVEHDDTEADTPQARGGLLLVK